jgi:hypothetical protein
MGDRGSEGRAVDEVDEVKERSGGRREGEEVVVN